MSTYRPTLAAAVVHARHFYLLQIYIKSRRLAVPSSIFLLSSSHSKVRSPANTWVYIQFFVFSSPVRIQFVTVTVKSDYNIQTTSHKQPQRMSTYRPILTAVVPQTNTQTDKHILRNCLSTCELHNQNYSSSVLHTAPSRTAAYISLHIKQAPSTWLQLATETALHYC